MKRRDSYLVSAMLLISCGIAGAQTVASHLAQQVASLRPRPDELKWQQIPWITNVKEGVALAKKEHRPIFLWVSRDDPLDRC